MKIIRLSKKSNAARVQAPLHYIRAIAHDSSHFPMHASDPVLRNGDAILLATHAKAYYQGGGWWFMAGYSFDGSDIERLLRHLETLDAPR